MKPFSTLLGGARRVLLAPMELASKTLVQPTDVFGPSEVVLYLHFPFCAAFCEYCVFNKSALRRDELLAYVEALERELAFYGAVPQLQGVRARALYLGGGTPSVLPAELVERVLAAVRRAFRFTSDAQLTLEANPESVQPQKLARYKKAGINRISLGVQSFDPALLERVGRKQRPGDVPRALEAIAAAGFEELNIDLMLGLPGQTLAELDRDVDQLIASQATHAAIFALVYRPESPLWDRRGQKKSAFELYDRAASRLERAGFRQYSAEDFTRSGRTCRYQDEVWKPGGKGFLGFGAGAMSMYGSASWFNVGPTADYVAATRAGPPTAGGSQASTLKQMLEHLMVSARSLRIDPRTFQRRFGVPLSRVVGPLPTLLSAAGLLRSEPGGAYGLTRRGAYVTTALWGELILRQCAEAGRALAPLAPVEAPPGERTDSRGAPVRAVP